MILFFKITATLCSILFWGSMDGWLQPHTTLQDTLDQIYWLICEIIILIAIWLK